MEQKTKSFNLEEALSGRKVITRSGLIVNQLKLYKGVRAFYYPLIGVTERGEYLYAKENGRQSDTQDSDLDLFIVTEEKEYWVATGHGLKGNGAFYCTNAFNTEQEAIDELKDDEDEYDMIQTHKITRYE